MDSHDWLPVHADPGDTREVRRRRRRVCGAATLWLAAATASGCQGRVVPADTAADETSTSSSTATSTSTTTTSDDVDADTTYVGDDGIKYDSGSDEDEHLYDVLIVVDNSSTMAQEQQHVAASFASIVDSLQALTDSTGNPLEPDVHLMVTTTDVGHPLCTPVQKPDYTPRAGAPVYDGCNARIARFTGLGDDPTNVEDACTTSCPVDIVPTDQFLRWNAEESNVPSGTPQQALACIGPQGIDGCDYESPLEAMLRALDPAACWNDPERDGCTDDPEWGKFSQPFLRDDAVLVVVIISDEAECSVAAPDGYTYFTSPNDDQYWEVHPDTAMPSPSSGICWNAGVSCDGPQVDGTFTNCMSTENPVLHPTDRYLDALESLGKDVFVLGVLGAPPVTEHNAQSPFEPTAGGVHALEYRVWADTDLTPSDIEAGVTVAHKVWEFGDIAPGCASEHGNAIFATRIQEVCEGLNRSDDPRTDDIIESRVRCCIESICDEQFTDAFHCLTPFATIYK